MADSGNFVSPISPITPFLSESRFDANRWLLPCIPVSSKTPKKSESRDSQSELINIVRNRDLLARQLGELNERIDMLVSQQRGQEKAQHPWQDARQGSRNRRTRLNESHNSVPRGAAMNHRDDSYSRQNSQQCPAVDLFNRFAPIQEEENQLSYDLDSFGGDLIQFAEASFGSASTDDEASTGDDIEHQRKSPPIAVADSTRTKQQKPGEKRGRASPNTAAQPPRKLANPGLAKPIPIEAFEEYLKQFEYMRIESATEEGWVADLQDDVRNLAAKKCIIKLMTKAPSGRANIKLMEALTDREKGLLIEAWNYEVPQNQQEDLEQEYEAFMNQSLERQRQKQNEIRLTNQYSTVPPKARGPREPQRGSHPRATSSRTEDRARQPAADSEGPSQGNERLPAEQVTSVEGPSQGSERQPDAPSQKKRSNNTPIGYMVDGIEGFLSRKELVREIARIAPNIKFSKIDRQDKGGLYLESRVETRKEADELFLRVGLPSDAFKEPSKAAPPALSVHRPGEPSSRQRPEDARKIVVKRLARNLSKEDVIEMLRDEEIEAEDAFWLTSDQFKTGKMCLLLKDETVARDLKAKQEIVIGHCYHPCEGNKPKQGPLRCFRCLKFGHTTRTCTLPEEQPNCLRCGTPGHSHKSCPVAQTDEANFKCSNCGKNHAATNKTCEAFIEAKRNLDEKIRVKLARNFRDADVPEFSAWGIRSEKQKQEKLDALITAILALVEAKTDNVEAIRGKIAPLILC